MKANKIFLKKTKNLEVSITNANPQTVQKLYKNLNSKIKSNLEDEINFYKKYTHPFFAKLINYEFSPSTAIFEYEYFKGFALDSYLKVYPADERVIFVKLMHFVAWLSYHNIFLSDLKPQHILVNKVNNQPEIKIIDITPNKDILTASWAAPEQLYGEISYKSNLYTVALIFASVYSSLDEVINCLNKGLPLNLPENSVIFNYQKKLLNKNPDLRPDDILSIAPFTQKTQYVNLTTAYTDFLSFHELICDTFYLKNISLGSTANLFEKHCLENAIICPANAQNCKLPKVKYKPLSEIIEEEKINPTQICINPDSTKQRKIDYSFEAAKMAYQAWDFTLFCKLWEWVLANLNKCHTCEINTLVWLAKTLAYEGFEDYAQYVLTTYYKKHLCISDDAAILWQTWVELNIFSSQYLKPLVVLNQNLLDNCSKKMVKNIEIIKQIRSYTLNQKYDLLGELFKTKISNEFKLVIAKILAQKAKMVSYFEPAINYACQQKDFYLLLNLLSIQHLNNKNNNFDYPIALASLSGSATAFAMVLSRQFKLAVEQNNIALVNKIAKIYDNQLINQTLPINIKQNVINQLVYVYYTNQNFAKLIKIVEENTDFVNALALCYYLLVKAFNHSFNISAPIVKILKNFSNEIKANSLFTAITTYFKLFGNDNEIDSFEKALRFRIKKIDEESIWSLRLNKLFNSKEFENVIDLYKTKPKLNLYNQAELNYYLALVYMQKNISITEPLNQATKLFNKIGLYYRCKSILKLRKGKNNKTESGFDFYTMLSSLNNCTNIDELIKTLSNLVYANFGFETTIPFIYDSKIKNFSPIGNYDFNEGYEGLTYSTKVLKSYQKNLQTTFVYDALEMSNSKSVHRLKIHKAYCIPIISSGEFLGTIYIHTRSLDASLNSKNIEDLQIIAALAGNMLFNLYTKQNKPVYLNQENFHGIIGKSPKIKAVCEYIAKIATFPYSVLIVGQSGVGKELVAKAIYAEGNYTGKMVSFNCSNLSKNLFESSLFGHKKGAFTGADTNQKGKIEEAENGLIFFDEIGELPFEMQAKLLRVLENRTFYPVGSTTELTTNARFVFATNQNLEQMVEKKEFRADLLARIKQFLIKVPPLKDHIEDLPLLVKHFTKTFFDENPNIKYEEISTNTINKWLNLSWSLNIRGLKYEVFRELVQAQTKMQGFDEEETETSPNAEFKVKLEQKLNQKQVAEQYVHWLKDVLGTPNKVIDFLGVTPPTYYRIIGKKKTKKDK